MDSTRRTLSQMTADARTMRTLARASVVRAKKAVERAKSVLVVIAAHRARAAMNLLPVCPKCRRNTHVEEEDTTGSSSRWFVCARCGIRFSVPPADSPLNW